MSANYSEDIELSITRVSSVIQQSIPTLQTKTKAIHFPYKVNQPQIKFQTHFRHEQDYELFQNFVRKHHLASIGSGNSVPSVSLWWPERGINNWTGYITEFTAGGERYNYRPQADFTVELVDSFVSRATTEASLGSSFSSLFGLQINFLRKDWWRYPKTPSTTSPPPASIGPGNDLRTLPQILLPLPQPGGSP